MADKILASVIRTVVPVVVGLLVAGGTRVGLHLTGDTFTAPITAGVTAVYYAGARWLEVHVGPKWGWLLGKAGAPKYPAQAVAVIAPYVESEGALAHPPVGSPPVDNPPPARAPDSVSIGWTAQQDDDPTKQV